MLFLNNASEHKWYANGARLFENDHKWLWHSSQQEHVGSFAIGLQRAHLNIYLNISSQNKSGQGFFDSPNSFSMCEKPDFLTMNLKL